ncbi:hypothetical protein A4X06_0g2064 [Tilletia controversa]|uniref:FHA domain-containing protein n=1 Tax=Tilletia controversa TaxID=13291 RepID=A0A8X7MYA7_9BASI|nr:hypothetical protein A4X06_0g2064 [Tilletia controversa]
MQNNSSRWDHRQQPLSYRDLDELPPSGRSDDPYTVSAGYYDDRFGHYGDGPQESRPPAPFDRYPGGTSHYHRENRRSRSPSPRHGSSTRPYYENRHQETYEVWTSADPRRHAEEERGAPREWTADDRHEYRHDAPLHRPYEASRHWDEVSDVEASRRPPRPYASDPDYGDHYRHPDPSEVANRFDPYTQRSEYERPPPRRYSTSPPPPPPPPPIPRSVAVQLRLVKLLSDALPANHTVAVLDSDYTGAGSGRAEDGVSFGRDRVFTRRVRLASMDVSKHHATIFRTAGIPTAFGGDGGWWLVDNGSAHGTFVLRREKRDQLSKGSNADAGRSGGEPQPRSLAQVTGSDPPLGAYHRLSDPKVASRPYEVRHGDLIRIGATIFEVHSHSSSTGSRSYAPSDNYATGATEGGYHRHHQPHCPEQTATCCEVCQLDFDGQNAILLLARDDAERKGSASQKSTSAADGSMLQPGPDRGSSMTDPDSSYASGAARPLAGDRKLDSEAEWKRKMKDLRGMYLDSGKGKGKVSTGGEASGPASGNGTTATVSWKKHLSSKKKRAAADDDIMVSISTAHLHHTPGSSTGSSKLADSAIAVAAPTYAAEPEQAQSIATSTPASSASGYVDRAAQRRLHAHSIEKTLPRGLANEVVGGSGFGQDPQHAARMAAAALPLPAPAPPRGKLAAPRATAFTPLGDSNRGFKLFSAMSGAGRSTATSTAGGSDSINDHVGTEGQHWQSSEHPESQHRKHQPILARGTSGRAGLGSGALRDVDEIAAASRQQSWNAGGSATYSEYVRDAAKRRWQESGQHGGS